MKEKIKTKDLFIFESTLEFTSIPDTSKIEGENCIYNFKPTKTGKQKTQGRLDLLAPDGSTKHYPFETEIIVE